MSKVFRPQLILPVVALFAASPLGAAESARERTSTPVGFFHFAADEQLDPETFRSAPVRTAIDWRMFEPREGEWTPPSENAQVREMDRLLREGKRPVPSLRARSDWAVEDPDEPKCASAPADLDVRTPLRPGEIYSRTYYDFVKRAAEYFKGRLEIVVVENEMNDADFWCSGVDEYLRVFLTAKTAFQDVDPSVRIADGGIQGAALNWLVIQDYLDRGDLPAAVSFHRKFSGKAVSPEELAKEAARHRSKGSVKRAAQLVASDLFRWDDIVNFHYYQRSEALPEVVAYLRRHIPDGKPLMTNEVGIKKKFSTVEEAAGELVKKYARLLALGVGPVIWFSPDGKKDHNAGALVDDEGRIVPRMKEALETVAKLLGRSALSCRDLSTGTAAKFLFRYEEEDVEVAWSDDSAAAPVFRVLEPEAGD